MIIMRMIFLTIPMLILVITATGQSMLRQEVIDNVRNPTIAKADSFLFLEPVTVTSAHCSRSAGGLHDFYSEADYFWPDPGNPGGPYIQKDGESYPGLFTDHRFAMIRFSDILATLTSAWLLTSDQKYARKAMDHLDAWFVDTATLMNPHMLYAQAIIGKNTGRGIGIIDAYHLVEVVQSVKQLGAGNVLSGKQLAAIKDWFDRFLTWMTTHKYGIDEMNTKNNHSTCWVVTASSMSTLTGNKEVTDLCTDRFKNVLLPNQMAADGSFPLEINRTKPYGYSLFNMDSFCNAAQILSTPEDNLWNYVTSDGKSLKKGMGFIFPYIADKSKWPYRKDIYIWDEWPVRQSCLLFAGLAYNNSGFIGKYLQLPAYPKHTEVIRNLPVRHPVIWLYKW
jgi:hypothetical protein